MVHLLYNWFMRTSGLFAVWRINGSIYSISLKPIVREKALVSENVYAYALLINEQKTLKWFLLFYVYFYSLFNDAVSIAVNTFTAIVNLSRFNNSCLKSPTSTLVDLTFQSRALRSFSLNQLRNLSL